MCFFLFLMVNVWTSLIGTMCLQSDTIWGCSDKVLFSKCSASSWKKNVQWKSTQNQHTIGACLPSSRQVPVHAGHVQKYVPGLILVLSPIALAQTSSWQKRFVLLVSVPKFCWLDSITLFFFYPKYDQMTKMPSLLCTSWSSTFLCSAWAVSCPLLDFCRDFLCLAPPLSVDTGAKWHTVKSCRWAACSCCFVRVAL